MSDETDNLPDREANDKSQDDDVIAALLNVPAGDDAQEPIPCTGCGAELEPMEVDGSCFQPRRLCDKCAQQRRSEERQDRLESTFRSRLESAVASKRHRALADESIELYPALHRLPASEESPNNAVYLWGETGTGKTTQLVTLVTRYLRSRIVDQEDPTATAQYANEGELFREIRDAFDAEDETASEVIDRYRTADLLALDDLGTAKATDWVAEQLYLIVNARYESLKPTVFAGNKSVFELAYTPDDDGPDGHPAYGDRVISRIYEMTDQCSDARVAQMTTNYRK
jgi:DNA replication protein DnaC